MKRRDFLKAAGVLAALPHTQQLSWAESGRVLVNDIHSQLNPTWVSRVETPQSIAELQAAVQRAWSEGQAVSIAGGRHAMGAQQFGTDTVLLDSSQLNRVVKFDPEAGTIEVGAGIHWPDLIREYLALQKESSQQRGIVQKQTGADKLSIAGALAANAHGRSLIHKPMVGDVESFTLLNAEGELIRCSRTENAELFRLAIGGYGLFGVMATVKLRLAPRRKLERVVELREVEGLSEVFEQRIADGFLYGDFQFAVDPKSDDFLQKGVFSCYRPIEDSDPMPAGQKQLSADNWRELLYLTHTNKSEAFRRYSDYYLSTSGQRYWSDTHQLSTYLDDYHRMLDYRVGARHRSTEVITEVYAERDKLADLLAEVRDDFRRNNVELIYGTIRWIERDDESFLPWARKDYACTVLNLHTPHTPEGKKHSARTFRRLIDIAIRHGGSYFLTYHKHATRKQVEACYPQFPEFLRLKRKYDSEERFQSDWYRHYKKMFADVL